MKVLAFFLLPMNAIFTIAYYTQGDIAGAVFFAVMMGLCVLMFALGD